MNRCPIDWRTRPHPSVATARSRATRSCNLCWAQTWQTTDVYAYLEDVAPDGSSLLVTEGQLRANYHRRKSAPDSLPVESRLRVKPALPWPGYTQADFDPAPFAGGKSVRLEFDLMPTAWLFRAGHRIRLSLAGADKDTFEASPAGGAQEVMWHLHRGDGQSVLVLPWIP